MYKQRYEFTTERRIRDKQERAAQRAAKAEAIKATAENQARNTPGGDSKKDAIKAAMERAKARKAALAAQKQESRDAS